MSKKTIIALNFNLLIYAFFVRGDAGLFQCVDCCLVSGLYWKIQILHILEQAWTIFNVFQGHSTNSHPFIFLLLSGTIFAHTFLLPRFSCKICMTVSLSKFDISPICCSNAQMTIFSNNSSDILNVINYF